MESRQDALYFTFIIQLKRFLNLSKNRNNTNSYRCLISWHLPRIWHQFLSTRLYQKRTTLAFIALELKRNNRKTATAVSLLDIYLESDTNSNLTTRLFEKRYAIYFAIVNFPHLDIYRSTAPSFELIFDNSYATVDVAVCLSTQPSYEYKEINQGDLFLNSCNLISQ